jgi:drug/metabolite transporter (DMT)-like permease
MPRATLFLLSLGILAISTAAPLIKLLPHVPALVVAAYRLVFAALALLPVSYTQGRGRTDRLDRQDVTLVVCAGVCLALHFATWISSLRYTSVASSVVLVTLNPLFLALAAYVLWGERLTRLLGLGIGLAVSGSVCIVWNDAQEPGDTLATNAVLGDGLALCGAVMASAYLLLGRLARPRISLGIYVGLVYGCAALTLVACCLVLGLPLLGYSGRTYVVLALLAFVPQLIGHTILNWALAYLSPTLVALTILGEPVGATMLAWLFLDEPVGWLQGAGALLILTGIGLGQARQGQPVPASRS